MQFLKNKYLWISVALVLAISGIVLWLRQYKCENGQYPWQNLTLPAVARGKCSFWTGKPLENKNVPAEENSAVPLPGGATGLYKMTVSKENGAPVYIISGNVFTKTSSKVPYGTELNGDISVTSSGVWYKTNKGWLNANDVSINNQSPH